MISGAACQIFRCSSDHFKRAPPPKETVSLLNSARLCSVAVVIVEAASESLLSLNSPVGFPFCRDRDDPLVTEALVITFRVIVNKVFANGNPQRSLPKRIVRSRHSYLIDLTNRSAKAFKFGERGGSFTDSIPHSARIARNWLV